jgi:hypothetical protein
MTIPKQSMELTELQSKYEDIKLKVEQLGRFL